MAEQNTEKTLWIVVALADDELCTLGNFHADTDKEAIKQAIEWGANEMQLRPHEYERELEKVEAFPIG